MDDELERLGRDHATVMLFKLLFSLLTRLNMRSADLKAMALDALALTEGQERTEADIRVNSAARDFVERVFGPAGQ